MARTIHRWRYGTAPNYSYAWLLSTEAAPAADAVIVEKITEGTVEIRQERKTSGHYVAKPILIADVPASGGVRYTDLIIPDYTNGLDLLSAHVDTSQFTTGDEIVCGKVIIGPIGQLAAPAAQNDTVITLASVLGVLRPTALGGALDEGFCLAIGTDTATAASINGGPPTGNFLNPDQELKEYEIKRIAAEQDIGGGNATCQVTLFTGLAAGHSAGATVNLVCPFIKDYVQVTQGGMLNLGGETITAGNVPAGKTIRFGYRNNGGSQKTIRAMFGMMY